MNTQQLRNFVAVAERRNITRAAEDLLIAQPALSLQLKTLEKSINAKLLIRKPRSVELTEAGRIYYQAAKHILQLEGNMETEIANIISGNRGVLKLGMTPSYPDAFLSKLLHRYSSKHPNVRFEIYERNSNELLTELESGIIELALIRSSYPLPATFQEICAYLERLYVFWSPDTVSLDGASPINPAALQDVPICIPRGLSSAILDGFHSCGLEPTVQAVCASRSMTLEIARLTGSVALLSASAATYQSMESGGLQSRNLHLPGFTAKRALVIRRGQTLSMAATFFIELLEST